MGELLKIGIPWLVDQANTICEVMIPLKTECQIIHACACAHQYVFSSSTIRLSLQEDENVRGSVLISHLLL